jgi:hypothetical protein
MAHFAKVENGVVTSVIVIEQDVLNLGHWGDPSLWVQTSYNTHGGVHTQGGTPLRKNYAGIGYTYDSGRDAFIPPKPYASWLLNDSTCQWGAPTAMPVVEGKRFVWRESDTSWIEQPTYPTDSKTYTWNLETGTWDEVVAPTA